MVKWVGFVIVPLFAFCNGGVALSGVEFSAVSWGIILGLVVGKPLGILGFVYAARFLKILELPTNLKFLQLLGVSFLAGIGFTMSLFIGSLAFKSQSLINESKLAILIASIIAASIGVSMLLMAADRKIEGVKRI